MEAANSYPINELYHIDFFIEDDVLRQILAQGHTIVPELERMIDEAIVNFDEYKETDWYENFFMLHALYLLYELDADQSLGTILKLLQQKSDFLDYWFSDSVYEEIPELLTRLGRNRIETLTAFLLSTGRKTPLSTRTMKKFRHVKS